jgi:2-dehydro-3-deoxygluconokinase
MRGPPSNCTLATFGETMLRLSVPDGTRLETAAQLDFAAAGAESNVAVTASRLGTDAVWLSKLPDSPLARRITHSLETHGVRTAVARSDGGRVGAYYIEPGGTPRGTDVIYDRADASIRSATPAELDMDSVRDADAFYVSGITPALSETLVETTLSLLRTAGDADTRRVFDLNYREKLWSQQRARETCHDLLSEVDTLVVAQRDARRVLGYDDTAAEIARSVVATHELETVIVTQGADGATAYHDGTCIDQPAFSAETVDPIGTGYAFVGGFITRRLAGDSVRTALKYAAATTALKRTITGDLAVITPAEVEAVLDAANTDISR